VAFRTVLILWFGAGFMLEALYLVRRNPKWTQLAGCAGLGLVIAAIAHLKHPDGDPFMYVGIGLGMSGVALAMFYQDEIRLYTWYLVIIVFLGCLQFPFGNLSIFHDGSALGWLGPIDAFATGMASLYLLTNAYYLSELLPIPGRNQSFSDRMKDWHELTDLMTQRCSDQDGPAEGPAFAIIGALGLLLLLNYVLELLPNSLVISAAIILAAMLLERAPIRETLGTAPPAPSPVRRARRQ
jgi:hypothetical protein